LQHVSEKEPNSDRKDQYDQFPQDTYWTQAQAYFAPMVGHRERSAYIGVDDNVFVYIEKGFTAGKAPSRVRVKHITKWYNQGLRSK
jgi:hypothetical protein